MIYNSMGRHNDYQEDIQHDSPLRQICYQKYVKNISWAVLYNSVGCLLERGQSAVVLANVRMKQRKSTASDFPLPS